MADQKVSDLPSLNGADVDPADLLYIIDSSAGSAGSKKITVGQYQLAPVSAGTANGVVYLNGSKVVTTGSALVFDGTNLGLGVTPSAWASGRKALQVSTGSGGAYLVSGSATQALLGANGYSDGANFRYAANGTATLFDQGAGGFAWFTALSGTAGDPISFGDAKMTLDASGNLAVGTSTTTGARIFSYVNNATLPGLGVRQDGAGPIQIWQSGGAIERARITSGGQLLVGTQTSNFGSRIVSYDDSSYTYESNRTGTGSEGHMAFSNANGAVGSIFTNGSATSYNTSSDYRLKDNPQPLINSGAFIDALQPKTWNWKVDGSKGVGFIAHEAQAVSPGSVVGEKDAVDEDGKPVMQAMEYGSAEFIANIIAELKSLRARVAALEA